MLPAVVIVQWTVFFFMLWGNTYARIMSLYSMILHFTVDNIVSIFSIVGVGSIWKLWLDVGAFCLELPQYILLSSFMNL